MTVDWPSIGTTAAVIVLAVVMFFRERIIQRPASSAEHQLAGTYKMLLEAQLLEMNSLKARVTQLERYKVIVEVVAEELAQHAPELAEKMAARIKE